MIHHRFVYLIGGRSLNGPVNNVQVYDVEKDTWTQATPFPGTPAFGMAGGMADEAIVVVDGAKPGASGGPRYVASDECWLGKIDHKDPSKIESRRPAPTFGDSSLCRVLRAVARPPGSQDLFFWLAPPRLTITKAPRMMAIPRTFPPSLLTTSCMDTGGKHLTRTHPTPELMAAALRIHHSAPWFWRDGKEFSGYGAGDAIFEKVNCLRTNRIWC